MDHESNKMTAINMGRIFEVSSERHITGRRRIKIILHEIFPSRNQWQDNGISWDETYTLQNLESVAGMSICAEFISEERRLPFGHGLTEIRDNMPLMENATVVGHCERGYIDTVEIDGVKRRVLIAEGTIDEMRYPKFVAWILENLDESGVKGSVEIIGRPENENRIIYDGGWKEHGRVPQIYDYGGYAILGISPADDAAIVMELNNKPEDNKEEAVMDKELLSQVAELTKTAVADAVAELNSKWDEYYARVEQKDAEITQLKADIAAKEAEIAQIRADYEAELAKAALAEAGLVEANAKISEMEKDKKIAELNAALNDFSEEEKALAKDEIEAFTADPDSYEINSITGKICVEMVRKEKELKANEKNDSVADIFGGIVDDSAADVDIF